MVGLIQKSGYIKPGSGGGHYAQYIATRDGVERADAPHPGGYAAYMAERPRSHGLFSAGGPADLTAATAEIDAHTGPVWTFIYSLHREDAARLGYESAESWRKLLLAHQTELATAMNIPPNHFRWCAAYHDEKHHPHIHMMVWSDDPTAGHLTKQGITQMRSTLSNDIFRDERLSLYQQKDKSYQQVRDAAAESLNRLIDQLIDGVCVSPDIASHLEQLSFALENVGGKHVYGYLKKPLKRQVDELVDALAKLPEVATCYEQWNKLRDELEGYYKDTPREHRPLSQQPEFKAIKNLILREAENLRQGAYRFADDPVEADMDDGLSPADDWLMAREYTCARDILEEYETLETEKAEQLPVLERLWAQGFIPAAYLLGKCWRDGLGVLPDDQQAERWFRLGADAGHPVSQYALGRLREEQGDSDGALYWYHKAAASGNGHAAYRLGRLYLQGKLVPKDVPLALDYLRQGAEANDPNALYTMALLHLSGELVPEKRNLARMYLVLSANLGNDQAQLCLDYLNQPRPELFLAATRLLHHLSGIFRDNAPAQPSPAGMTVDQKLRRKLREKRVALGQKTDDHEEPQYGGWNMPGY